MSLKIFFLFPVAALADLNVDCTGSQCEDCISISYRDDETV